MIQRLMVEGVQNREECGKREGCPPNCVMSREVFGCGSLVLLGGKTMSAAAHEAAHVNV